MLIKRVVIQGFKTFAKKTEFVFDPGVTAIVGPNGSGKSNVSDAIRWCLGEQSFSLLRSKKTSDIIFSGSDLKSRLGMAQVTVTLDNASGGLPVDFAEVEITRRAYRDGDNEYLVNGQRVRLQDITEILAPSGLGKRTYALIGQGLIDRMLTMSPEELRSLFEEAAGITAHQLKRTAALRRMEAAQQNLTRVQDIVAEISPRLGYLRRQAERAREREQIAHDLRDLLHDWYGYHWHTTLRRFEEDSAHAEALGSRVELHRSELTAISATGDENRRRQTILRSRLGDLHRRSSGLHTRAEQTGRDLAVAQERLRQVHARAEEARQERAPLRLQHETLTATIDEVHTEIAERCRISSLRHGEVERLQAELARRQQARQTLQQAVVAARRKLTEVQSKRDRLESQLQQIEERSARLTGEIDDQQSSQQGASAQHSVLSAELDTAVRLRQALQGDLANVQDELAADETAISQARVALEEARSRRQQADREADRLKTRLDLLSRLHNEGAGYASGVREVLQAAQTPSGPSGETAAQRSIKTPGSPNPHPLTGVVGVIASLLHVPAHVEKAIETALGGAFQNVVTRTWDDAQQAIEYLKANRRGRATFLPLDRLDILPPISAPSMPGVLGNAADLVDYDQTVAPAARQLLNRVWVVDNLTTARRALDSVYGAQTRHGPRPTVVTLDGDIVRPGGALTGGSDNRQNDESILARERELRELPARIRQAADVAQSRAAECQRFTARIEQLETGLAPKRELLADLARQERTAADQAAELLRQMDSASHTGRWHADRLAALKEEIVAGQHQVTQLGSQLVELEQQREAAELTLRQAEHELESSGDGEPLQRLADLRASEAEAQSDLRSSETILEDRQRNLQSLAGQIAAKENQITALDAEEKALVAQINQLNHTEDTLSQEISAFQRDIEPLEADLTTLETEQTRHEEKERGIQEALRADESAWNAALLKQQRTDDALRRLRQDIEQDLGLVFLEESDGLAYQPPLPWETIVEQLEPLGNLPEGLDEEVREMRARLSRVRNVNPDAPREYEEAAARCSFLETQSADLSAAIYDLRKVIAELDSLMKAELTVTFNAVAEQFVYFFNTLFGGGAAKLVLLDPDNITASGIEIVARPPGKRPQSLALLSGGERSLAACALLFAILRVSPTPFCVLDEVDAALDEANVDRFRATLDELSHDTQFIIITHNRRTLENTNAIYGVTLASDGVSRVISLRLEGERVVKEETGDAEAPNEAADRASDETDAGLAAIKNAVRM